MLNKELLKKYSAIVTSQLFLLQLMPLQTISADYNNNLLINEVCTQNKNCLLDSYGNASDWIELYNSGNTEINLGGYGITDDSANLYKWTFPADYTLKAGEYAVIFASKQASVSNEYHTGFALSKSGETLTLTDKFGNTVQSIKIPALAEDTTYGLSQNGSFTEMSPTPAEENAVSVPTPEFSVSSGFYDTEFKLTLSSENEIYYTIDGSDPETSDSVIKYTDGILISDCTSNPNIYSNYQHDDTAYSITLQTKYKAPGYNVDKGNVIKAVAKDKNGNFSKTVTNTYFIFEGEKLDYYKEATVVSLVTDPENLFNADTGIYVAGTQYIDWKNSPDYDPSKSEWDTDNVANFFSRGRDWERPVSFTVFENGKEIISQNMGIRIKGASTRNSNVKNFNLYARGEYGESKLEYPILEDNISESTGKTIKKYDSISLRAVNWHNRLNDTIAQPLLAERNLATQTMKPCLVFIDGEFWGFYEITEKYSDYYVQTHYDVPKENVAMIKNSELEEGVEEDTWDFWNMNNDLDYDNLSDDTVYNKYCEKVDIESLIEHYCSGIYLGTYDWPNYNYAVWRNKGEQIAGNPYSDGKWRFMTFDLDYTIGMTYSTFGDVEGYEYDSFQHVDNNKKYVPAKFFTKFSENEKFKEQFALTYCDYANHVLSPNTVKKFLEVHNPEVEKLYAQSMLRWSGYSNQNNAQTIFDNNLNDFNNNYIPNVNTFFEKRADYTLEDMKNYFNLQGTLEDITLKINGNGQIKINTITPEITENGWTGQYFTDYPVTVTAIGDNFTYWSGDIDSTERTVTVPFSTAITLQANFDNSYDITDLIQLKQYILGVTKTIENGDINKDSKINVIDVTYLKNILI